LGGTVTAGIVSARARDIKIGMLNDFVQIDAPMNQGNSGGPTFDLQGDVVGVNSAIFSPSGGSIGIGFAIPAETVAEVVTKLRERGAVVRGWLGVQIQTVTPEMAHVLGMKEIRGALVVEPDASGPAARAGIAAGDVIRTVNGEAVQDERELVKRIAGLAPGSTVSLDISRREDRRTIDVTIAEMPDGRLVAPAPAQRPRVNP
jgi:serine protease Do